MYILAAIGIISFFVTVGLGFSFTKMAFKVSDYNALQAENTELKVEKKNLEVTTKSSLPSSLTSKHFPPNSTPSSKPTNF